MNQAEFLKNFIDSGEAKMYLKDNQGRFLMVNRSVAEMIGASQEEIIGKTDFDVMPTDLAEKYRRDDLRVLETRESLEMEEETTSSEGRRIHIRVFKVPVRNAQGDIIGTQGFLWDDSEHKRLQEALLSSS